MKTRGFEVIKDEMRVHPEVEIQLQEVQDMI